MTSEDQKSQHKDIILILMPEVTSTSECEVLSLIPPEFLLLALEMPVGNEVRLPVMGWKIYGDLGGMDPGEGSDWGGEETQCLEM